MHIPRLFAAILALIPAITGIVCAQEYPTKPIRIITAGAGGGADFTARQVAHGIAGALGQPVIVDNRNRAVLAAEVVAKAPPDGYTLTVSGGSVWIYPLLQKAAYDIEKDLSPITMTERTVYVVAVHLSLPVKSIKDLIALAKSRPGELNYASTGVGGTPHLATELFKSKADVNILHAWL